MKRIACVFICLAMVFCSAASEAEDAVKYADNLSDRELIKLVASVQNTRPKTWEDEVARDVTLEKLIKISRKRRSDEIRHSGVLKCRYKQLDINRWPHDRLKELYGLLRMKNEKINWNTLQYSMAREKALFFMREMTKEMVAKIIMPKSGPSGGFYGSWWS
jgi:hypothetical protein